VLVVVLFEVAIIAIISSGTIRGSYRNATDAADDATHTTTSTNTTATTTTTAEYGTTTTNDD